MVKVMRFLDRILPEWLEVPIAALTDFFVNVDPASKPSKYKGK